MPGQGTTIHLRASRPNSLISRLPNIRTSYENAECFTGSADPGGGKSGNSAMRQPRSNEQSPHVRKHLLPEECRRLVAAAGKRGRCQLRDKTLVSMTWRHGLRASEACNLQWDQVDLNNATLYVRRSKGGKPSTHSLERDELHALRKLRQDTTGAFVFESERGGPISVDTLARICAQAGVDAGIAVHVHPHMLRHGAGYSLINAGVDVRLVQDFLGHRNIATTTIYTELAPKRLAAVRVR
jgi:integrase